MGHDEQRRRRFPVRKVNDSEKVLAAAVPEDDGFFLDHAGILPGAAPVDAKMSTALLMRSDRPSGQ
jgi:hypothetical protein